MTLAHRVSWEIHFDRPTDDALVLHKCPGGGNPWCVNPTHLSLGDHVENADDMLRAGRHWSTTGVWSPAIGERSPNTKLTEQMVADARRRVAAGEWREVIAAEYGVPTGTLSSAISGQSWKHMTNPPPFKATRGGHRVAHR